MLPPVFSILSVLIEIQDIFGDSPVRIYPFGEAPEDVARPYATYSVFNGIPENYIGDRSDIDNAGTQIDVWANNADECRIAADLIRDNLEDYAHMTAYAGNERDTKTKLFRTRMDFDFFISR